MFPQTKLFPIGSSIVIHGLAYELLCDENNIYTVGEIKPTPEWVECDKTTSYSCGDYEVELFSGAWEGEGAFIISNRKNEWLIHFDDSESFNFAELKTNQIRLISKEYPFENEWLVTMDGGNLITIEKKAKHLQK